MLLEYSFMVWKMQEVSRNKSFQLFSYCLSHFFMNSSFHILLWSLQPSTDIKTDIVGRFLYLHFVSDRKRRRALPTRDDWLRQGVTWPECLCRRVRSNSIKVFLEPHQVRQPEGKREERIGTRNVEQTSKGLHSSRPSRYTVELQTTLWAVHSKFPVVDKKSGTSIQFCSFFLTISLTHSHSPPSTSLKTPGAESVTRNSTKYRLRPL